MSFESGSASFRAFYMPRELPADVVERFAKLALPPLNSLGRGELHGWVGSRHLLDRVITEDNAYVGGYLRLNLVKVEKKIPEALLRAECKMEELALMQAEGKPFLNRAERAKIKKEVTDRLLPTMPPMLTGIPVAYDANNRILYAGATSEKKTDAFLVNFQMTTGVGPVPIDATSAARKRKKIDVTSLGSVSFSPEVENDIAGGSLGQDFLTWLWFHSEARGGLLDVDGDSYGILIEGPLTFFMEGGGAHVATLRQGSPLQSAEAKTALLSGKKLIQAQVTLARTKETWTTGFDGNEFVFRGFKTPKTEEKLDAISQFQQRMISTHRFLNAFLCFYDRFLDDRCEPKKWKSVQKDVFKWVEERASKK